MIFFLLKHSLIVVLVLTFLKFLSNVTPILRIVCLEIYWRTNDTSCPKGTFTLYDCDCDFSYCKEWVVQDLMQGFTLCDCNNITNPIQPIGSKNKSQS